MRKIKFVLFLIFNIFIFVNSGFSRDDVISLQKSFISVAEKVEPAVVSISTTKTVKTFSPFFDDKIFRDFFGDFFERFYDDIPRGRKYQQRGLGSGIIIDISGYILTNEHVVSKAEEITVTLPDGREFKGKLVGSDPSSDIAVIKIDTKGEKIPVAILGNSDKVRVGEWAIAIGNPFAWQMTDESKKKKIQPTVTVGVISAVGRSVEVQNRFYEDLIQTDAAINPGNSGGPLCNIHGEVIGMNTAILTPVGGNIGIGFAIPINKAKEILKELIDKGKVVRGYLGVLPQDITDEMVKHFGLPSSEGALVADIVEGGPAQKADIRIGDVIIEFDGKKISSAQDLRKIVAKTQPKKKVKVVVIRDGKEKTIEIVTGERPPDEQEIEIENWRGLTVKEITQDIAKHFRLKDTEGVVVTQVEPRSPSDKIIREGDIILEINKEKIKSIDDYKRVVSNIPKNETAIVLLKRGKHNYYKVIPQEEEKK